MEKNKASLSSRPLFIVFTPPLSFVQIGREYEEPTRTFTTVNRGIYIYTHTNNMRVQFPLRQLQNVLIRSTKGNPTGLTGILTHPNPRPALMTVYQMTLEELKLKFPETSVYRQSLETLTKSRLEIVEANETVEKIENQIGCGLIEEVLIQAAEEYDLMNEMAEWKVWEELEEKPLPDQWTYFGKKL